MYYEDEVAMAHIRVSDAIMRGDRGHLHRVLASLSASAGRDI